MLLKKFCEAKGINGYENEIRKVIYEEIKDNVNKAYIDNLGNLIAVKNGRDSEFKVLLCAHMDEVGGMVTGILDNGFIKFYPVGEMDIGVLPAKKILIGDRMVPGVIGIRSIHLQKQEQRLENIKVEDLYIDIGAEKKDEAEKLVSLADYIVFQSDFENFGEDFIKSKALDNRAGCAVVADLLTKQYNFELTAAFTIQQEVGCRGAAVISKNIDFNLAVVICTVPCDDAFDTEDCKSEISLGKGPVLYFGKHCDNNSVKKLEDIFRLAEKNGIIFQKAIAVEDVYEAEILKQSKSGGEVLMLGIPCRNIHSPACIISKNDYSKCKEIISLILENYSRL